jgi:hypothetical protein
MCKGRYLLDFVGTLGYPQTAPIGLHFESDAEKIAAKFLRDRKIEAGDLIKVDASDSKNRTFVKRISTQEESN